MSKMPRALVTTEAIVARRSFLRKERGRLAKAKEGD
jgi:hypothetical protein